MIQVLTRPPSRPTRTPLAWAAEGSWRYLSGSGPPGVSDPAWGTPLDTMDRLTVELTWLDVEEAALPVPMHTPLAGDDRGSVSSG